MSDNCGRNGLMKKRLFTVEEELELAIYNAIEALIINQILNQAEQRTKEKSKYYRQRELKVIHTSYKRLLKLKYRLSEKTLQEMSDDLTYSNEFLPTVSAEYFFGCVRGSSDHGHLNLYGMIVSLLSFTVKECY